METLSAEILGWMGRYTDAAPPVPSTPALEAMSATMTPADRFPWATVVLGLYLAGVGIGLGRLAVTLRSIGRIRRESCRLDVAWLEKWRRRLDARGPVTWAASDRLTTPALLGCWRPHVVVPASWHEPRHLDAALAHELAHLRRGDHMWTLVGRIVGCLYWFHPLVHLCRRRWREDTEHACDDLAVAHLGDARSYSEVLLAAARSAVRPMGVTMAVRGVAARVERLLRNECPPHPRRGTLVSAILALSLTAGCLASTHHTTSPRPPVTVDVLASGEVRLEGRVVPPDRLMAEAEALHKRTGSIRVHIHVDSSVTLGEVSKVQAATRRAGFVEMVVQGPRTLEREVVHVELLDDGRLRLEGQALSVDEFAEAAAAMHSQSAILQIHFQDGAKQSFLSEVMRLASVAGFSDLVVCSDDPPAKSVDPD